MHRRELGAGGGKYIVTQDLTPCAPARSMQIDQRVNVWGAHDWKYWHHHFNTFVVHFEGNTVAKITE